MESGYSPDNGLEILKNIIGFSFTGITGNVTIDENGDRLVDYIVRIYQNGSVSYI